MDAVYNKNTHTLYMIAPRTGSSLLHDISCFVPDMVYISITQAFAILKQRPDTAIYITYRDPNIRFRSGLSVNLRQDIVDTPESERPTLELISDYIRKIRYLDFCMSKQAAAELYNHSEHPGYYHRPYHLYDQHLDHCLWRPFLLLLHGYNVKLLCISEWSDHLRTQYPGCEHLILEHERKDSQSKPAHGTQVLWNAYYSVFGDASSMPSHSWQTWMEQEQLVYESLKKANSSILGSDKPLRSALSRLISAGIYFTDTSTMNHKHMVQFLREIEQQKDVDSEIKEHLVETSSCLIGRHQIIKDSFS